MSDDDKIKEYLQAVLDAFQAKALAYHDAAADTKERFARTTEIKNALRGVGRRDTFSIAAGDYGHCASGVCNGQVCTARLSFGGDEELRDIAVNLGFSDDIFFPA